MNNLSDDLFEDTKKENYMTELEFTNLVKGFNSHLRSSAKQVEDLGLAGLSLKEKVKNQKKKRKILEGLVFDEKVKENELSELLEVKIKAFKEIEGKIQNRFSARPRGNTEFWTGDVQQLWELFKYLSELEEQKVLLNTQSAILELQVNKKTQDSQLESFCINCKESYCLANNLSGACNYHPGKLKYFSCRGCGADPYYDCCLKCKMCSKGCRKSLHSS